MTKITSACKSVETLSLLLFHFISVHYSQTGFYKNDWMFLNNQPEVFISKEGPSGYLETSVGGFKTLYWVLQNTRLDVSKYPARRFLYDLICGPQRIN